MTTDQTSAAPMPPVSYNGQFTHGLDEKRRLQIPSKWRPASGEVGGKALVWPKGGLQGHYLVVLTAESHARVMQKLNAASKGDEKALGGVGGFNSHSRRLGDGKKG